MEDKQKADKSKIEKKWAPGKWLRNITGWAFIAAAIGAYLEAVLPQLPGGGTIGLIPLYLGFPIGSVGFVLILRKTEGWIAAVLAAVGFSGFAYFMGTYPDHPEGIIGLVLVGTAQIFIPLPGRLIAVLWIAAGIFNLREFHFRTWGVVDGWLVFTAATALTGIYVLLGQKRGKKD
jgi:ABC-type multidrug transport system permease subunit